MQRDGHAPSRENVLVVEDDATVRAVLARVLRREGFGVREFALAGEALDFAAGPGGEGLRVAVCDAQLPDLAGLELATRLRRSRPALRVLMVSGAVLGDEELAARGVSGFLQKPFVSEELAARVRSFFAT